MNELIKTKKRDIQTVTLEIRALHSQIQRIALNYAVEIGRRLIEAKEMLPHGEWGAWLKAEAEFSQSTANNFMRLFEEYGAEQIGLFGAEANSQTLGNLSYSKALSLIALPAEEREEFVKEHDAESLSTRELNRLVRERDEALRAAEEERAHTEEQKRKKTEAERELQAAIEAADKLRKELDTLKAVPVDVIVAEQEQEITDKALTAAAAEARREEKEKAKKRMEKAIADKERELNDKLLAEEEKRTLAEAELEKIRLERDSLKQTAKITEKKLAAADLETAQFAVLFEEVQELTNKLFALASNVFGEKRTKLSAALCTVFSAYVKKAEELKESKKDVRNGGS